MKRNVVIPMLLAVLLVFMAFSGVLIPSASADPPPVLPSIVDPLYTQPIADPTAIPKFVNPVPQPGAIDMRAGGSMEMYMGRTQHDFGLLGPGTPLLAEAWGYGPAPDAITYPGPTILAKKNKQINVTWYNQLGNSHPLPVDPYIHYTFSHPPYEGHTVEELGVPAVPHLHGGHTESDSDGIPESWWTPGYHTDPTEMLYTGMTFVKNTYTYDNSQEAATLWYHDHALGITRLNVYMGLAGFYLLTDKREERLVANDRLPSGPYEKGLVIQDRMFYPDGSLAYPDVPAEDVEGFEPWPGGPSTQPEFFGEVILVNGKAWPVMEVEPRKYRFRVLNGSDSRFYNMWMDAPVATKRPLNFIQVGTDDGFTPLPLSRKELLIGPGERYDVVVDFSDPALNGQTIIVRNNAAAPFPDGDPVNADTSGQIMAFKVTAPMEADPVRLPVVIRPPIIPDRPTAPARKLLLFEALDEYGRLKPSLGTIAGGAMSWMDPVTEDPSLNSTEVWEIYNTTMDAHPIHLHLVSFKVLSRQSFTATQDPITGALSDVVLTGKRKHPSVYESGPKDTVIMYPGEVTRIIATFDRPGLYVWHCHILSHEDHEMMRPLNVIP